MPNWICRMQGLAESSRATQEVLISVLLRLFQWWQKGWVCLRKSVILIALLILVTSLRRSTCILIVFWNHRKRCLPLSGSKELRVDLSCWKFLLVGTLLDGCTFVGPQMFPLWTVVNFLPSRRIAIVTGKFYIDVEGIRGNNMWKGLPKICLMASFWRSCQWKTSMFVCAQLMMWRIFTMLIVQLTRGRVVPR